MNRQFLPNLPIWQAPTGSIAGPELCAAVAAAGAMGAMGLTWTPPEIAAEAVGMVRAATPNPFLVNFALAFPPLALNAVLDAGAPVVSFSWGDPAPHLARVRAAGAAWGVQVTDENSARRAFDLGADFLICQGVEAGGHVESAAPLWELLPRIVEAANGTPVIAAGGIADGATVVRAVNMGAAGAMLGTRFVATRESRAHSAYKQRLVEATGEDTALTLAFDGGWPNAPHRVLRNATLEAWEAAGRPAAPHRPGEGEVTGYTATAEPLFRYDDAAPREGFTGDILSMCLYAGTGCDAITDVPPVATLVARLAAEMARA